MSNFAPSPQASSATSGVATSSRATMVWTRVAIGLLVLLTISVTAERLWPRVRPMPTSGDQFAEGRALPGTSAPVAGQLAPDFEMVYADGKRVRLSDLRGQPVLINFWASWCGPCRVEMPELVKAHDAHRSHGLVILAVNVEETIQQVQPFVDEFDMPFPVVLDSAGEVSRQYQVRNLPSSIFIDRTGTIAVRWVGILTPEQLQKHLERIL